MRQFALSIKRNFVNALFAHSSAPYMLPVGVAPCAYFSGLMIMTLNRRTAFSAAAVLSFAATLVTVPVTAIPAAAADGAAPYCISRGGSNGESSYVGNCIYFDYQQCLQAAADTRGNCVQNIDYHGGTAPAPAARRPRRAR
jgi:hypothetical protein